MKNKFIYIFVICFTIFNLSKLDAQVDNPLLDQIPQQYLDYISTVTPRPFSIITDNSGYDNFDLGFDFAEVHMVTNPRNPLQYSAAWNVTSSLGAKAYYTMNGIDWSVTANPPWATVMRGDPVMAYDSLGNLFFENMYGSPDILGTKVAISSDNGQSWNSSVIANIGNDKNWIAADQTGGPYANYIYSVMTPGNVVRSTDHGASYNLVFSASNSLPGMMVCVGANVLGGNNTPGGCVYVVTSTGSPFQATWTFFRSTNGGATFDAMSVQNFANYVGTNVNGRNSVQNMRTRPYPFITADNSYGPNRGRLYLIYASNSPAGDGNKPDIFCRYSTDHGVSWSAEVRVNDDPNSEAHNQWMPATWCDKETGKLYVQWMDTRDCPTSDSCLIYATYSSNGGASFEANQQVSNQKFRINCTTCGGGGVPAYLGDYNSITSNSNTSMLAWTDFRAGGFGSYVGYFPDYAMKTNPSLVNVNSGQSVNFNVVVPSVKLYTGRVKFTASIDTMPTSGSLNVSFVGKDSITSYPDSVTIKVDAAGTIPPGRYRVNVLARGNNGTPAHRRTVDVYVNSSLVTVGTNRPGTAEFKVNGVTYNQQQQLVFINGASVTIQAVSPRTIGNTQYVFTNWSNGGDTTQVITVNSNITLTAFYKIQYRLLVNSTVGNTFGGGIFYDSASNPTFGVLSRSIVSGGTTYYFRGWNGAGSGSYTSPDSTGADSAVTINNILNLIIETARWSTTVGINQISSIIPDKYNLYQNYPNPFNPTTNIKFDLIRSNNVKVIIYNMLGKEVEILLNEFLQPGSYRVDFNGNNLSSGIYYYKIVTNEFSDVKKMLLIK